jgi:hypothetical protein
MEAHAIPSAPRRGAEPRRFSSRRVHPDELISHHHRWWHTLTARAWVLLLPMLGFALADALLVRTSVGSAQAEKSRAIRSAAGRSDEIRAQIDQARMSSNGAQAAIEAEYLPRLVRQRAILDSLIQRHRMGETDLSACQVRVDSLRALRQRQEAKTQSGAQDLRDRAAILINLRSWRSGLQDSLARQEQALALANAELLRRERRRQHQELFGYVWYVLGPCLGVIWVQNS